MTGANAGVGLETTRQLVTQGAPVVMACRRVDAGEVAAASFADLSGTREMMCLDLADLQSVRDFVAGFTATHDGLDGLVCNAGMVNTSGELQRTKDRFESTIGVSFFGHFLLTELLLDTLRAWWPMQTPNPNARSMDTVTKLVDMSDGLVGLDEPNRPAGLVLTQS